MIKAVGGGFATLQTIVASGMIVEPHAFRYSGNMTIRNRCLHLYSMQLIRKELGF